MIKNFALANLILSLLSSAHAQTPFYQGKTITVIVSTSPGGTGDLRVKALVPFLRKHIPGNPSLVLEYMDGGGGRKGANHLFRGARADGLTIGAMSSSVISLNVMRESGVLYDLDKFIYLGAPESVGHQVLYTRKELGTNSLEKLKAKSGLRIGAQSVGHVSVCRRTTIRLPFGLERQQIHRRLHRSGTRCRAVRAASSTRAPTPPCRYCGATRTGSTKASWTFTPSWRSPRASNMRA